ncbi:MAG: GNAT family N-acetyltransferase [Prevotellaceae bacterium]|jgi:GNAT superfamily N-acetyltransferase|nr:GNAT family N-acetyltransferase [Prevotellaceae bacterium]
MHIQSFDCGDPDLNDFLADDAKDYYAQLMGVTYLVECKEKELAAYYCLFTDKIVFDFSDKGDYKRKWWQVFNKKNKIHFKKRRKSYPAVKIGRLAVASNFERNGIGRFILDAVKFMLVESRNIGCRFLTVDAYKNALGFYQKNGFDFLSTEDENEDTRLMYFDLKNVVRSY